MTRWTEDSKKQQREWGGDKEKCNKGQRKSDLKGTGELQGMYTGNPGGDRLNHWIGQGS